MDTRDFSSGTRQQPAELVAPGPPRLLPGRRQDHYNPVWPILARWSQPTSARVLSANPLALPSAGCVRENPAAFTVRRRPPEPPQAPPATPPRIVCRDKLPGLPSDLRLHRTLEGKLVPLTSLRSCLCFSLFALSITFGPYAFGHFPGVGLSV